MRFSPVYCTTSVASLRESLIFMIVIIMVVLMCLSIRISIVSFETPSHSESHSQCSGMREQSSSLSVGSVNGKGISPQNFADKPNDIHNHTVNSAIKTIIFWSGYYINPPSEWKVKMGEMVCGQYRCKLTYDRCKYREGDAFIFHLRCPSWVEDMLKLTAVGERLPHQRWVLYNRESAWWTKGEELTPADGLFNWTIGFRRDNDIYMPTAFVKRGQYQDGYNSGKNYIEGKTGHVAVLTSMCNFGGYVARSKYIDLLKKFGLHIDIYGNCGKKCGSYENCIEILKTYKFVLAVENSLCDDYISEKAYLNGFRAGIIPIVVSKANLSDPAILPPGSFINALQFSNTAALVEHVYKVGSDPVLYNSYFKWRSDWTFTMVSEAEGHQPYPDDYFCPLCEKLHRDKELKTVPNLRKWYEQEKCQPFPTN